MERLFQFKYLNWINDPDGVSYKELNGMADHRNKKGVTVCAIRQAKPWIESDCYETDGRSLARPYVCIEHTVTWSGVVKPSYCASEAHLCPILHLDIVSDNDIRFLDARAAALNK